MKEIEMTDYTKYYWLEKYLFDEVGPKFREQRVIEPADLFMIFIWKANRAKTKERRRLARLSRDRSFSTASAEIARQISEAAEPKEKMRVLMECWRMRLPMASAVLTVLDPNEFTVYDRRIRRQLGLKKDYANRRFSEDLWKFYCGLKERITQRVHKEAPALSLRDCDRWLWGKSQREQAMKDCR